MKPASIDPETILQAIQKKLSIVDDIISITLVGSASDQQSINISDIDTVVICKKLNASIFEQCIQSVSTLSGESIGFPNKKVYINSTFGPLKFDTEETIVIHLMIYDIEGHQEHVLKSPMTCLDWERSDLYWGQPLRTIYPVISLQLRDFSEARRGLQDYIEDIEHSVLSYRQYCFDNNCVQTIKKKQVLDKRLCGEYAYHIIKNLTTNFIKWKTQTNTVLEHTHWRLSALQALPFMSKYLEWYEALRVSKMQGTYRYPSDTLDTLKYFLQDFEYHILELEKKCLKVTFMRHYKTALNDGTFLGQGRDPGVLHKPPIDTYRHWDTVYTSPKTRCLETASHLAPHRPIITDDRLLEFNYGLAEGMSIDRFQKAYPSTIDAWKRHEDPPFPQGENTATVYQRLQDFLKDIQSHSGSILVVTHHGILRCLVGNAYHLPKHSWHAITIPHGIALDWLYLDGSWYPHLDSALKKTLTDTIASLCHATPLS